jgi:hypothetical protein
MRSRPSKKTFVLIKLLRCQNVKKKLNIFTLGFGDIYTYTVSHKRQTNCCISDRCTILCTIRKYSVSMRINCRTIFRTNPHTIWYRSKAKIYISRNRKAKKSSPKNVIVSKLVHFSLWEGGNDRFRENKIGSNLK